MNLMIREMEIRGEEYAKGRAKGVDETQLKNIRNLMESFNLTQQEAMRGLKIPESDWGRVKKSL